MLDLARRDLFQAAAVMGRSGQIDLDRNVAVRRNDAADHAGAMALQSITKLDQRSIELGDQTHLDLNRHSRP